LFKRGGVAEKDAAETDAADDAWVESLKADEPKKVEEPEPEVVAAAKGGLFKKRTPKAAPAVVEDEGSVEEDAVEAVETKPDPEPAKEPEVKVADASKGGLFKRTPKSAPAVVEDAAPEPEPAKEPEATKVIESKAKSEPVKVSKAATVEESKPEPVNEPEPTKADEPTSKPEPVVAAPTSKQEGRLSGLIRRVRGK
jgi:hypothetical protein